MSSQIADIRSDTDAPKLDSCPPLVMAIILLGALLLLLGCAIAIYADGFAKFLSVIPAIAGGSIFTIGRITHSTSNPREAGVITYFGAPDRLTSKPVVVGGTVFVIPFLMDTTKFPVDNHVQKIPDILVVSSDQVPVLGTLTLTWFPDIEDVLDYLQAGANMKEAAEQLSGPVVEEIKNIANTLTVKQICFEGTLISKEFDSRLARKQVGQGLINQKGLGIKLKFLKTDFPLPKSIMESMHQVNAEEYERTAERLDSETITAMAMDMQRVTALQYIVEYAGKTLADLRNDGEALKKIDEKIVELLTAGKIKPLDDYMEAALLRRLTRDKNVKVIKGSTGNFTIQRG